MNAFHFLILSIAFVCANTENLITNSTTNDYNVLNIDLSRFKVIMNGTNIRVEKINIDKSNEVLEDNLAELCSYGENPKLEEICPNLKMSDHKTNLTLKSIESKIINATILKHLRSNCNTLSEWCIPESVTFLANTPELTKIANKNEKALCIFASCFSSVKKYIKNCVKSELTRDVLSLGEHLCHFNDIKSTTNNLCTENTMRLLHLSVARYNLSQYNVSVFFSFDSSLKKLASILNQFSCLDKFFIFFKFCY